MTAIRVLIVDDEPLALERHAHLCAGIEGLLTVRTLMVSSDVLASVADLKPDLVLLDISMPGLDGIALGRALNKMVNGPKLVFATAHSDFAVAAFDLAAVDYLLKPISLERLRTAVERVRAVLGSRHAPAQLEAIWVPRGSQMVRIDVGSIDLVEAERDYVRLQAEGRSILVRGTIEAFERRLAPAHFIRIHRSAIVPVAAIRSIDTAGERCTILLANGRRVKVGPSYRIALRRLMSGGADRDSSAVGAIRHAGGPAAGAREP